MWESTLRVIVMPVAVLSSDGLQSHCWLAEGGAASRRAGDFCITLQIYIFSIISRFHLGKGHPRGDFHSSWSPDIVPITAVVSGWNRQTPSRSRFRAAAAVYCQLWGITSKDWIYSNCSAVEFKELKTPNYYFSRHQWRIRSTCYPFKLSSLF